MAEAAPLMSAHNHVRNAATELNNVRFTQAAQEHEYAAADFARTSKGTSDEEALRILRLLEAEHHRLARIVRSQDIPQQETTVQEPKATASQSTAQNVSTTSPPPEKSSATKARSTPSALASARVGSQVRDSSPSLARDIATRRGIPQPGKLLSSATAQARERQHSPQSQRRRNPGSVIPKVPPSIVDSQADLREREKAKKTEDDDGFARFYSNLTSGTMSKLSSVLAYAGLPLTAEDAVRMDPESKQKSSEPTVSASNEPNVKKIFSKAALDAIEDEHRQRGTFGQGFGPTESFYVVQKGGGTYSYADIARAQQQQQLESVGEDDELEFVDAKEVPDGSTSPTRRRLSSPQTRSSFGHPRTQEELELENTTLKTTLEQLAGRLAAFEAHAQDASMAALTQSMANIRHTPAPMSTATAPNPAVVERLQHLEKMLEEQAEERERIQTLTQKQQKDLKKYRHWYDELKKSAKDKEKARKAKSEKTTAEEDLGDGVAGE